MTHSPDLIAALLAAEGVERERLIRSTDARVLESALGELGHRREPAAAEVLALVDLVVEDRGLRKTARRELHRLRSMGIEAPPMQATPEPRRPSSQAPLAVTEAWATEIDPSGARTLWLVADRPLGGVWFSALLLNDLHGLEEMSLVDTTRKRFARDLEEMRSRAGMWVRLPGDYALGLVREAVDLTREVGGALPTRYHSFRDTFGEAAAAPERALVYATISPVEVKFNPAWLDESPRLTTEPEVRGWHVPIPPGLRARALEAARAPATGLLVPGHTPEDQVAQLLSDVAQQVLTPAMRRALRRRLEETGYILVATDRLNAARLAVAAALPLDDSHLVPERHPFLRLLMAAGLARLVGSEKVGPRPAAEVLIEIVERTTQREAQDGPLETRPSGLILPR